ncbi:hypothetical protein B296_00014325 [Ensete ventricosum]|uniref:Uncharacterized protein n=1 Tax=Ensete ventricosum TaxID=4639 RepID=A0A427B626_ENSVE|nr:hypothetical protein B296_00014325 [Ensete ventricosum]
MPCPRAGGRRGALSPARGRGDASSRVGRQGVALFICGETLVSMVPPGSGRPVYQFPIEVIRAARTERYSSKQKTLIDIQIHRIKNTDPPSVESHRSFWW